EPPPDQATARAPALLAAALDAARGLAVRVRTRRAVRAHAEERRRLAVRVVPIRTGEAERRRVDRAGRRESPRVHRDADARQPYPVALDDRARAGRGRRGSAHVRATIREG